MTPTTAKGSKLFLWCRRPHRLRWHLLAEGNRATIRQQQERLAQMGFREFRLLTDPDDSPNLPPPPREP